MKYVIERTNKNYEIFVLTLELKTETRETKTIYLQPSPPEYIVVSIYGNAYYKSKKQKHCFTSGQIKDDACRSFPNDKQIQRICDLWDRWHLNDMKAGTKRQETAIEDYKSCMLPDDIRRLGYAEECEALKSKNLLDDGGYRYGSAWLLEVVPQEVIDELKTLFGAVV